MRIAIGTACVALAALACTVPAQAGRLSHRRPVAPLTIRQRAEPRIVAAPRPVAAPLDVALNGGLFFRTPFTIVAAGDHEAVLRIPPYRGPDGAFDTLTDEVQAINGTPCDEACTRRALVRWGYAPAY